MTADVERFSRRGVSNRGEHHDGAIIEPLPDCIGVHAPRLAGVLIVDPIDYADRLRHHEVTGSHPEPRSGHR
jgi:hypothetical protein